MTAVITALQVFQLCVVHSGCGWYRNICLCLLINSQYITLIHLTHVPQQCRQSGIFIQLISEVVISRATTQATGSRLLFWDARICSQDSPRGLCDGQIFTALGHVYFLVIRFFSVRMTPPLLYIHSGIIWRLHNVPLSGRSST